LKVLLVLAHPNPQSFNAALVQHACQHLVQAGHQVQISDLYAQSFDPVLSQAELSDSLLGKYRPEVKAEMDRLAWADLLVLQAPDWWYGLPAILRGWFDRVLAYGFAYREGCEFETGLLRGKRVVISLTVGGSGDYVAQHPLRSVDNLLKPIHYGVLAYCGFEVLPPFLVHAPKEMSVSERVQTLEAFGQYLLQTPNLAPLDWNPTS
jgi:NAD(P)H dehydrogenase (quinone)